MKPPLPPILRNALLVGVFLGAASIYIVRAVRVYLAQRSADSAQLQEQPEKQLEQMERAIRLAPDDAEFPHLLGVRLLAADRDGGRAIANLRQAIRLNPNSGRYWLDLAAVYQVTGNAEKQNEALQGAVSAEPGNPEVAAEAGQYFLVAGDADRAFPLFRQALAQNPEAANSLLPECWRQTRDANLVVSQVIPDSPDLQIAFLRLLTEQKESVAASQVWQYLTASQRSFDPQLSFFYLDYLVRAHDVAGFDRAWRKLAGLAPYLRDYLPNDNLIVNGGFEQPILNSGFDWRHEPVDHIAAGIDQNVAHSGARSLSLSYDGNPASDAGWKQFVPVQANADYEFSAWMKSDNVTSSSGPRIAIADAYSGASILLTDDVLDTHSWQQIQGTLRVPANTELVALKIVRDPPESRIRGRVWIDDLRLVKR